MASSLALTGLPRDLIRILVCMADDSIADVRLIAPSWNDVVLEYLSRPRFGALERLYLCAGGENAGDEEDSETLRVAAILPSRYAKTAGVGHWLSVMQRYTGGVIEVTSLKNEATREAEESDPFEINVVRPRHLPTVFDCCLIVTLAAAHLLAFAPAALAYSLLGAASVLLALAYCTSRRKMAAMRNVPRLARFLTLFSRLDTLVIEHSRLADPRIPSAVLEALGPIKIGRLDIAERAVTSCLQLQIVEMCRAHGIRHLFVRASYVNLVNFYDFVLQLAALGVIFDLYESDRYANNQLTYFGRSRLFWDKMTSALSDQKISLKMTTIHDAAFSISGYNYQARVHIRCERSDDTTPLQPVENSRGFSLGSWNIF